MKHQKGLPSRTRAAVPHAVVADDALPPAAIATQTHPDSLSDLAEWQSATPPNKWVSPRVALILMACLLLGTLVLSRTRAPFHATNRVPFNPTTLAFDHWASSYGSVFTKMAVDTEAIHSAANANAPQRIIGLCQTWRTDTIAAQKDPPIPDALANQYFQTMLLYTYAAATDCVTGETTQDVALLQRSTEETQLAAAELTILNQEMDRLVATTTAAPHPTAKAVR